MLTGNSTPKLPCKETRPRNSRKTRSTRKKTQKNIHRGRRYSYTDSHYDSGTGFDSSATINVVHQKAKFKSSSPK